MGLEDLQISVKSLIEVSSMLGLHLEDFAQVRNRQINSYVLDLQNKTSSVLDMPDKEKHFYVTAMDFLLYEEHGQKKFKFVEINGSGFTGLSNISVFGIQTVLNELTNVAKHVNDNPPIIIVPCSGTREIKTSGRPSMVYEKILFAQAIKDGFKKHLGSGCMVNLYDLLQEEHFDPKGPTVVIGYLMDFMNYLDCVDGKIHFLGKPISGGTHDRFCDNVANTFKETIDLNKFYSINNMFLFTADKGNAYGLFNDFRKTSDFKMFDNEIFYKRVFSRDELILNVLEMIYNENKKLVIKPHGAALGRGIEFFVQSTPEDEIIRKIDESIQATNRFCGVQGWAFPYTIVPFVDCCTIPKQTYPLYGHKFEMRVIVYREGNSLKAFPSIVKISSKQYNPANPDRLMLLNNVAAASGLTKTDSTNYMLPLSNPETLDIIGITLEELEELAAFCTQYVRHGINKIHREPIILKDNYSSSLVA